MKKHEELFKLYDSRKHEIKNRLLEFKGVLDKSEEDVFAELCFCLLVPQSKARVCDKSVRMLKRTERLLKGNTNEVERCLEGIRFPENKARFIVEAREKFIERGISLKKKLKSFSSSYQAREWLVKNVKGVGYKGASHFLRNVGLGEDLAILDRHIQKNLVVFGVIDDVPKTLTVKKYLEIERKMKRFSKEVKIPLGELDLLFWSKETGEVFK